MQVDKLEKHKKRFCHHHPLMVTCTLHDTENLPCSGALGRQPRTAGFCRRRSGRSGLSPATCWACAGSAPGGAAGHPPPSPLPALAQGRPWGPIFSPRCDSSLQARPGVGRELWRKQSAWPVGPSGPAGGGKGALLRVPHWSVGQMQGFVASSGHSPPWASPTFPVPWPRTSLSPPPRPVDATGNAFWGSVCYPHPVSLILVPQSRAVWASAP